MGSFFSNIHIYATDTAQVSEHIKEIAGSAYVVQSAPNWVSVFPQKTEDESSDALTDLAEALSKVLDTWIMGFYVYDSDFFNYHIYKDGEEVDVYDSNPSYWDDGDQPPTGGNMDLLMKLCGEGADKERLSHILYASNDDDDYVFAEDRAVQLAQCLGIDEECAGTGFNYLESDGKNGKFVLLP